MSVLLSLRNISKRFGGVVALAGVDFSLRAGEIHALCGENGAGKSTLIKILSGIHAAGSYQGEYRLADREVAFTSYADAAAAGLAVIYQELALCGELSVAENIFLGHEPRRGLLTRGESGRPLLPLFIDHGRMIKESARLLSTFGIALDPRSRVDSLGVGQKQLVEIAKALARRSHILVLDEPTAALSDRECAVLMDLLRDLRRRGTACVYISHKLDEVFALADRITVLRDGKTVLSQPSEALSTAQVISAMCGRTVEALFPVRPTVPPPASGVADPSDVPSQPPLLSVAGLSFAADTSHPPRLRDVSFTVRAGEIVGIGGLLGSGRSELLRHLFGAYGTRLAGEVKLRGQPFAPRAPHESLAQGVVLLSEERRRDGLCMDATVGDNFSLSSLAQLVPGKVGLARLCGLLDPRKERERNLKMAGRVRLRSAVATGESEKLLALRARALSGGNQQKVVLGKALLAGPQLLLLDEPTRGVDIGAKQDLYELICDLCAGGLGVLLVSSELPELLGLCDRILVLADGQIAGEFSGRVATAEDLLTAALGASARGAKPERMNQAATTLPGAAPSPASEPAP